MGNKTKTFLKTIACTGLVITAWTAGLYVGRSDAERQYKPNSARLQQNILDYDNQLRSTIVEEMKSLDERIANTPNDKKLPEVRNEVLRVSTNYLELTHLLYK